MSVCRVVARPSEAICFFANLPGRYPAAVVVMPGVRGGTTGGPASTAFVEVTVEAAGTGGREAEDPEGQACLALSQGFSGIMNQRGKRMDQTENREV